MILQQKETSRILFISLLLVISSNMQARYDFSLDRGKVKQLRAAAFPFFSLVGQSICWIGVRSLWSGLADKYIISNFRYYREPQFHHCQRGPIADKASSGGRIWNAMGYCYWNTIYNTDLCARFLLDFFFAIKIVSSSRRFLKAIKEKKIIHCKQ